MKKLYLLDGHALIYRAHFAFIGRPLINSKGWNVSAVQGFIRTLWDLIQTEKPTHLAVAFDLPGGTFRHERFEEYKANREAQPEDITFGIPWVERIIRAMNIPVVSVPRYEADDVIGTLAKQAARMGYEVYMVTPDKDFGQLVEESIFLYRPGRQGNEVEKWGIKEVCERWGIRRVEQVVDMLALMGDAVDNIPGLPGIGEKTAAKLLETFDTVENLLANADQLKGKQQEIVQQHADKAILSKWLATIDEQVPIRFEEPAFRIEPFNREALIEIFRELEFRTLAEAILKHPLAGAATSSSIVSEQKKPIGKPAKKSPPAHPAGIQGDLFRDVQEPNKEETSEVPPDTAAELPAASVAEWNIHNTPHQYHLADTPDKRARLLRLLENAKSFSYDSETTSIEATQADLVGLSFALQPHEAWYVPMPADRSETQAILEEFRGVLEDQAIEKIGQNLKYDAIVLKNYGIRLNGPYWDTMLAHYLLEPELRHNMNYMSETCLKYSPVKIEELIGKKGPAQLTMREVPVEKVKEYAAEDADITLRLRDYLKPKLEEGGVRLVQLFHQVETPLVKVLADLEYAGVRIDTGFLQDYAITLDQQIREREMAILASTGHQFNVASPRQLGEVLFDRMKIPYPGRKMKSGQYSTDEEVLNDLAPSYPVCAQILQYRMLTKLKSTYVDALPALVNPRTGRIHSSFNQALAATGRLSSQNPNLQNIPVKTPEGRKIREAFIPRNENHIIMSADYSQIELRLIAEISGDEAMLDAFRRQLDIHTATAARVYGVPLEAVTPEQRRAAKTVNFSIIYGAGASNLSTQLGIKRTEAKELIDNYFREYNGLRKYMEDMVGFARTHGYVETKMGRRRYLRDIDSRNGMMRSMSERIAINTPIQGTAADLIKVAMIRIWETMQAEKMTSSMILQVHDELVFDVHLDELERLKAIVTDRMIHALPDLQVPLVVGMGTGKNWLEAH